MTKWTDIATFFKGKQFSFCCQAQSSQIWYPSKKRFQSYKLQKNCSPFYYQEWKQSCALYRFLDFLLKKQFLWRNWITSQFFTLPKGLKVSFCSQAQSSQTSADLKTGFRVATSKKTFTILLYIGKLAVKQAPKHPRNFIK